MKSVAAPADLKGTCDGCLNLATGLTASAGDRLCKACRAVFLAAAVLLNEEVAEEEVIIPTLVLAKMAGGSPGYEALAKTEKPTAGLDIINLMYKAEADDYAGWELADVVEDVPLMRIRRMTANPTMHPGTQILHSVRIQVLSRRTEPSAVREDYGRVLREQSVRWDLNIGGSLDYDFTHGYLGITAAPLRDEGIGADPLRRASLHFPPPVLVEGFYKAVLGSAQARTKKGFAHGLDLYGKPALRTPENLIMAFAAWHIGGELGQELRYAVPPRARPRVARVLNRQVRPTRPLEDRPDPNETLWRTVETDAPRFLRLCTRGLANFQTGV